MSEQIGHISESVAIIAAAASSFSFPTTDNDAHDEKILHP
jgi:hypothetical protein